MTQSKLKRGLATFAAATVMGAGLVGLAVSTSSVAAENVAGQPGTPSEYKLLFWEGFENRTSSWEFLGDYTGSEAANNGQGLNNEGIQYTSDAYWQSTDNCTGILMGSDLVSKPSSTFCGANNAWFNQVKLLMENLPNKDSQTSIASYTTGAATLPQDGVVVRTDPTTPISVPGATDRFLTFGLDAAALNCYPSFASHAHPVLAFSYIDASGTEHLIADRLDASGNLRDTTVTNGILPSWLPGAASAYGYVTQFSNWGAVPTARQNPNGWNVITNRDIPFYADNTTQFSKQYWTYTDTALINPCADFSSARSTVADPRGTTDLAAGSFINKSGFLNEGDTVQLILRNRAYTGSGNDGVIDNLKVYDVTPQLDVQYGDWDGTDSQHEGNNDSEMIRYTGESTITYTITNRSDLGSKFGWTFENTLPEGLEFAGDPVIAGAGAIDSATLNNWSFDGNNKFIFTDGYLDVNQQTLTITIPIRNVDPAIANADIVKKYTTETASFTSVRGLDLPNPASIRWYNFEEKSEGLQGQPQTVTPTYVDANGTTVTPSVDNPAKLIDPTTGQPTDETTIPAMKDGKQIGTYTIDPLTGEITFQPNPDFIGTPDPVESAVLGQDGQPLINVYTPTVTPVTPTGTPVTSEGLQGASQTGQPTFAPGADIVPITISADNPAKLIDPATG
ncbi:MAG: hypothetical protein SPG61_07160, partial [Arcanobacterium sp.]|nr:hypothetical protein [Arcanobacterium sp.]